MKNARYREVDKAINRSARNDHGALIENKAKLAEEPAKKVNYRTL